MSKCTPNPSSRSKLSDNKMQSDIHLNSRKPIDVDRNLGIRIGRDGTWYYMDSPINRRPLVKLFANVLQRGDDGKYYLVTPFESGFIEVDDVPFVAVHLIAEGKGNEGRLTFRTNLDEQVVAGVNNLIRVEIDPVTGEPTPYIRIRDNLDALISRSVFYELVNIAEEVMVGNSSDLCVWSEGKMFSLGSLGPGD